MSTESRKNEARRHHYIPQFILRNFTDDEGHLYYYEKKTDTLSMVKPRDIFMERDLYRDEKNHEDDATVIEKELAVYESEIADLFRDKIIGRDKIRLTVDEEAKLMLFFVIMVLRSKNTESLFKGELEKELEQLSAYFEKTDDYESLWKNNLLAVSKCRSLREVVESKDIDNRFKMIIHFAAGGLIPKYFIFGKRKGKMDFCLTDRYPMPLIAEAPMGDITVLEYYPISPEMIIIAAIKHVQLAPKDVIDLSDTVLREPVVFKDKGEILYTVKNIESKNVRDINQHMIQYSREGVVYRDKKRFIDLREKTEE